MQKEELFAPDLLGLFVLCMLHWSAISLITRTRIHDKVELWEEKVQTLPF